VSLQPDVLPDVLREFRHWLQEQAERGVAHEMAERGRGEAMVWAERAGAGGFTVFRNLRSLQQGGATAMLQAHYICLQYERMIVGVADVVT
jgi:hypothetical protein